jgi:hypothetical protein
MNCPQHELSFGFVAANAPPQLGVRRQAIDGGS